MTDGTRPPWDEYFLTIAQAVAARADCTRRRVGAVLVESTTNHIIATGYNGSPSGEPGCLTDGACPRGRRTYAEQPPEGSYADCTAVHAEANALLHATRSARGATMYVTDKPCPDCAKLLKGAGVTRIVAPLPS